MEYLEELEDDCGFEIEFDPIAFCCDYAEYPSLYEWAKDYGCDDLNADIAECDDEDDADDIIRDYIQDRGTLIEFEAYRVLSRVSTANGQRSRLPHMHS